MSKCPVLDGYLQWHIPSPQCRQGPLLQRSKTWK